MRRALELAQQGAGRVNPNPLVGCVIVKDGKTFAEAYYAQYRGEHAEAKALAQAGEAAQGAELYVNYEPCVNFANKRTPPCVDRIVEAGIARAVIATRDPTPEVRGQGIEQLREAGVDVVEGVLEDEARRLNEIRDKFATTGRPFVLYKSAMSLDGKIATRAGDARWISSDESRTLVHQWRNRLAAVLIGTETALRDDPRLTVRHVDGRDPARIVLDSRGRLSPDSLVFHLDSDAPTIVATVAMPAETETTLRSLQSSTAIEVWRMPGNAEGRVDLTALMTALGKRGIDSVLVEGGSDVAAALLNAGLIDKLAFFVAPMLVGGDEAPGPLGGAGAERVPQAVPLSNPAVAWSGPDLLYTAYPTDEEPRHD